MPATAPTFTDSEEFDVPRVTLTELADIPIVKSAAGAFTVSDTVVVWVVVPSVPLMVSEVVPVGVDEVV